MKCPLCEGTIEDRGLTFSCSNQKQEKNEETGEWEEVGTCTYKVWKTAFSKLGGEELTEDVLEKIIVEGECEIDLISKAGKPYKGFAIVDPQWGVKIDFSRFDKKD